MNKFLKSLFVISLSAVITVGAFWSPSFTAAEDVVDVTVEVDLDRRYQTMEGFGFHGGQDTWWSPIASIERNLDDWCDKVINDLGITMWRSEMYPNIPVNANTDGDDGGNTLPHWHKQINTVKALKKTADEAGRPFKVLLTAWSPPGEFKVGTDPESALNNQTAIRKEEVHKYGTKKGGTLNPKKYVDYANWWIAGLDMYKEEAGVDVFAISLQNEPAFAQDFNSCIYTAQWYREMIENVVPLIKEKHPNVKIFGTEEMLTDAIQSKSLMTEFLYEKSGRDLMDVFAVHGYSDGVNAEAIENHKALWERLYEEYSKPYDKPLWMTETSGYSMHYFGADGVPGGFDVGIAIGSALKYGKVSGWVWWQGEEVYTGDDDVYTLMDMTGKGKKYQVSKHYYRYINPGTVMVDAISSNEEVLTTAFHDKDTNNFTSVILNNNDYPVKVKFSGTDIKDSFKMYLTTSEDGMDNKDMGDIANGEITIPERSIATVVNNETVHTPLPFLANPKIKGKVYTNTTTLTGTYETNGATISAYNTVSGKKLGSAKVKGGKFSIKIKAQLPGKKIYLYAKKDGFREGVGKNYTVALQKPTIKAVKKTSKVITGTAYKGSSLEATVKGKLVAKGKADKKGKFSLRVEGKLTKGKSLKIKSIAKVSGKKYSKSASKKIK